MCKNYKCAPLPFMGQKRYFIRDFSEVLKQVAAGKNRRQHLDRAGLHHATKTAIP